MEVARFSASGHQPSRQDLDHVLTLAQNAVSQQFAVSERIDAKARGQLTVAGTWFALVQAVAGVTTAVGSMDRGFVIAIIAIAGIGIVLLGATMYFSAAAWALRVEEEIDPDELLKLKDWAYEPSEQRDVDVELLLHYREVLADRMKNNEDRTAALKASQVWWAAAMLTAFAELAVALFARIG